MRLSREWGVELVALMPGATCSEVWSCSGETVLKIPASHAEERQGAEAMRAFSGHGGVQVLRVEPETGATLQRRVSPGNMLVAEPEESAVTVCAELILRMRQAPLVSAMPVDDWFRRFTQDNRSLLAEALAVIRDLFASMPEPRLLHGDLHHYNILRDSNGWTFIDPKGMIGDPSFEVGQFMFNPLHIEPDENLLRLRLSAFASLLGDPPERLWGWTVAKAALNVWWDEEDGGDAGRELRILERLWALRREFAH